MGVPTRFITGEMAAFTRVRLMIRARDTVKASVSIEVATFFKESGIRETFTAYAKLFTTQEMFTRVNSKTESKLALVK